MNGERQSRLGTGVGGSSGEIAELRHRTPQATTAYSTAIIVLLVVLAAIWLPTAYVASYYLACDSSTDPSMRLIIRRYRYQWQRCLFDPAAQFESSATGSEIVIPDNYSPAGN